MGAPRGSGGLERKLFAAIGKLERHLTGGDLKMNRAIHVSAEILTGDRNAGGFQILEDRAAVACADFERVRAVEHTGSTSEKDAKATHVGAHADQ